MKYTNSLILKKRSIIKYIQKKVQMGKIEEDFQMQIAIIILFGFLKAYQFFKVYHCCL